MTLRIHFTADDLARTRLAEGPRPLLELDVALRVLRESAHPVRFDAWRRESFARLAPRARLAFEAVPVKGWSLEFLLPAEPGSAQELWERVRATPAPRVREQVDQWAGRVQRIPPWTGRLAEEPLFLRELVDVFADTYDQLVAPYWPRIGQLADTDRAMRMRQLAEGGVERLLQGLNPRRVRWNPPVLELTMASGHEGDLYLEGRGLLLIPTLFGSAFPVFDDTAPQPWISFPIGHGRTPWFPLPATVTAGALTGTPRSLAALLGRTRATVLCAIAEHPGLTTSQLASRAGISPASASEHATVLRSAGLVSTARDRNAVLHTPTAAGIGLLNASTADTTGPEPAVLRA
ncbi:winged helix-turn-helix domain-containing protein [Streptomyces melanogenes]|uniref:winged helix-turn-helix domain-containing protein n=1 Tax=Streptomyces melanogenes TaxID=67326 RepID=UPI003799C966